MSNVKEKIFSHAVALHQSGRFQNIILAKGRSIFILNSDHTVLLRFTLSSNEIPFSGSISFNANDYDSKKFEKKENHVIFTQDNPSYSRKKFCKSPGESFESISKLYETYNNGYSHLLNHLSLDISILDLLQEDLSHIEIVPGDGGQAKIIQRDIFTGNLIEIEKKKRKGLSLHSNDSMNEYKNKIGMRTVDFKALFSFNEEITLYLPNSDEAGWIYVEGKKFGMEGVISCCYYDELGTILNLERGNGGRKKPEDRRSE